MSELVDRLDRVVKERGLTFNRIERELGLGNGTIKRWNDQSLDYLVFGTLRAESAPSGELDLSRVREEQGLVCDGSPLSSLETDLVAMFRLLPEEEREDVFDIVHLKYKRRLGKKAGSIYWTYFDENDEESGPAEGREARDGTA